MPYDDPDPADPQMLVGVSVPGGPAELRLMARAIAQEFAQLGYHRTELLALFANPFYRAPHQLLQVLGHDAVAQIIDETLAAWGGWQVRVTGPFEEPTPDPRRPRRGHGRLRQGAKE